MSLPYDVARCAGVSYHDDRGSWWRDGCETCRRRTDPGHPKWQSHMAPPPVIAFECEYLIEPEPCDAQGRGD